MCAREGDLVSLWTHAGSREEMYQDVFVSYMCKKCFFSFVISFSQQTLLRMMTRAGIRLSRRTALPLRRSSWGCGQPWASRGALRLGPLDVQVQQLQLAPVEAGQVRLEAAVSNQLVQGHHAEDRRLAHARLHVVISLQYKSDKSE